MADEGVVIRVAKSEPSDEERRRAVSSLLCIAQRMNYLVEPFATGKFDGAKVAGELGGMAAWIEAFTCQLAGLPMQLTAAPEGELMLATVEVSTHTPRLVDAVATLPSEALRGQATDAATRRAALALSLVALAFHAIEPSVRCDRATDEVAWRHQEAEIRLRARLEAAVHAYFNVDLDPNQYVPELSAHGMPEDG